jgi:protein ImuB
LPLAVLDQPDETVRMLAVMGVRTIGACLALPRDGLARRFGRGLRDELDRALGRLPDPRVPYRAPARYRSKLDLPAPVEQTEALLFAAKRLILELTGYLRTKQAGVTRLDLKLHHPDRTPTVVKLRFALASRDPQRILLLLRERLSSLQLRDRVEAIGLESAQARPLASRNLSLFPEDRLPEEARWLVIEHLRARLGADAVYSVATYPDHRPERAWRACEPGEHAQEEAQTLRPLWLLERPRPLQADGDLPVLNGPLTLLAGPERIESGWWDEEDVQRDYFVAADLEGIRFWIFRDRCAARGWFLQGVFG